jgi:hypothetical protein
LRRFLERKVQTFASFIIVGAGQPGQLLGIHPHLLSRLPRPSGYRSQMSSNQMVPCVCGSVMLNPVSTTLT